MQGCIFFHPTWEHPQIIYDKMICFRLSFFSGSPFSFLLPRAGEPEPEPGVFGSLETEPLEKKNKSRIRLEKKSGAGAARKLAGSSALREDKKHKEIVLQLLFFR